LWTGVGSKSKPRVGSRSEGVTNADRKTLREKNKGRKFKVKGGEVKRT